MSRVMMLVSAEGVTLAETRVDGEDAQAEAKLRAEARVSGFSDDEVSSANLVLIGDFPVQP